MASERSAGHETGQQTAEPVVLVVDDDKDLADTCQYWLDDGRYTVETAYGGTAALERLDDSIDVVLLDRRMPSISGDDVLDEIRARDIDCRVAMMTAVEPDTDIVDMPFDAYLVKPVSESEVTETVEELLVRSGFEAEVREYFALESTEEALESRDVEELRHPNALGDLRDRLDAIRNEHETAIENREQQLARVTRVNDLLREVDRAIVDARTRDEIEQTVCESVADAHEAAFVARRTAAGLLRCTAVSGLDIDPSAVDLDFITDALGTDISPGDVRAVDGISDSHRAAVFNGQADQFDSVSALCVPISYRETVYGILVVYDDGTQFDEESASVFSDLGSSVGNGINAIESKRLLNGDSVVELEFSFGPESDALAAVTADLGCDLSLDGVAQVDDTVTCFATVRGAPAADVVEAVDDRDQFESARVVADGDDESVVELRLAEESILIAAAEYGASIEALELDGGRGTLALHVAPDADHGAIAETLSESIPGTSVVAKREVERTVTSTESFRTDLDDKLTERQQSVLETSYVSGYFDWPRGSTAEEVADALGISPPTLHEHLRTAERKLIETYFEDKRESKDD
ncbi:bacterio-opsin activator domain-containing protein [Haloferax larsenii]|uniref:GAF domain-containing protein n=1 Tax=Haloferax larsenii TaxID=302484 RepID=A0A1H7IWB4_HALLR|nr:bacterio-opsin activator domain-containing protein [Haloferax larsenii]SEK66534.1 GAF domain-containing protein [Haloferax larsenii]